MKDLLRTSDLTPEDLDRLLALAGEAKADRSVDPGLLRGRTVVLYSARSCRASPSWPLPTKWY
jgi:ornithine carbamoyltransferase